ncbi:MAG TPA: hypothetical protein VN829_17650 [Dongiaceae bacterium]|nr:hypothetical protein [Dongiaceae bacterium]
MKEEMKKEKSKNPPEPGRAGPHRVRLPGFLVKEEIGLGDVIKRITYSMGIPTCSGCEQRAQALNRWVKFTR